MVDSDIRKQNSDKVLDIDPDKRVERESRQSMEKISNSYGLGKIM